MVDIQPQDPNAQVQAPAQTPAPAPVGSTPLDPTAIKALQTAIEGAVASVLSILEPGALTHDQVLQKVSDAVMSLQKSEPLGGLQNPPGIGLPETESPGEDAGEPGEEPA